MDRQDLIDRLPGRGLRRRLPLIGGDEAASEPTTATAETPPPDVEAGPEEFDPDARWDPEMEEIVDAPEAVAEPDSGDGRRRLRTVLLGVSVFGGVLAVVAALVRRALGRDADDDEQEPEEEPEPEAESPPLEEGTAAALGLAFLLVAEAIRDWLTDSTH